GVPRAGDHPVLDPAPAERSAHVRANVVDGVVTVRGAEDGNQLVAHLDRLALVLRQVADPAHRLELAHTALSGLDAFARASPAADWTARGFPDMIIADGAPERCAPPTGEKFNARS